MKMKNVIVITSILLSIALWGCVRKDNIRISLSTPLPHPELNKMQSTHIQREDELKFGIKYPDSLARYNQAEQCLTLHKNKMDVIKFVERSLLCMH
jgi:hypothetical protein